MFKGPFATILETLYGILGEGAYFRGEGLLSEFYGIFRRLFLTPHPLPLVLTIILIPLFKKEDMLSYADFLEKKTYSLTRTADLL